MSTQLNFKTRVKEIAISKSQIYKREYIDKEYLIFSNQFTKKKWYRLSSTKANYKHLIGIYSDLTPEIFFDKCFNGSLTEDDFNFSHPLKTVSEIKGSVRRKIIALDEIDTLIASGMMVEESFRKNNVFCTIAAANSNATLGFAGTDKHRTKSLMKGNQLLNKTSIPNLVLLKSITDVKFSTILIGDIDSLCDNYHSIRYCELITDELITQIETNIKFNK